MSARFYACVLVLSFLHPQFAHGAPFSYDYMEVFFGSTQSTTIDSSRTRTFSGIGFDYSITESAYITAAVAEAGSTSTAAGLGGHCALGGSTDFFAEVGFVRSTADSGAAAALGIRHAFSEVFEISFGTSGDTVGDGGQSLDVGLRFNTKEAISIEVWASRDIGGGENAPDGKGSGLALQYNF